MPQLDLTSENTTLMGLSMGGSAHSLSRSNIRVSLVEPLLSVPPIWPLRSRERISFARTDGFCRLTSKAQLNGQTPITWLGMDGAKDSRFIWSTEPMRDPKFTEGGRRLSERMEKKGNSADNGCGEWRDPFLQVDVVSRPNGSGLELVERGCPIRIRQPPPKQPPGEYTPIR